MESFCEGCGKQIVSKLQCPQCVKLGLDQSIFCNQDCFKKNWSKHKKKHDNTNTDININTNPWPNFNNEYTGSLRPYYPLSPMRFVPEHISLPDYARTGIPISERALYGNTSITVLSKTDIEKMKTVCKMAREVLDLAASHLRIGITTDEIDEIVHNAIIERGAYPSPLNYYKFPKSVCTSVNEVICHGIPDHRPLQNGDIINLDVTLFYDGFHGDLNETYTIGEVDQAGIKLISSAKECLEEAIKICKPGVRYREIGNIVEKIAQKNGHSIVKTYGGHGIHRLFHCAPSIPHYAKNKAIGIMRPGHVFTIEPMINEGAWQDKIWPDEWTVVTTDGKRSAQFEHTLLITETGVEVLTMKK